jgi:ATP-dependent protease HslVU (ClpYQ) peptidase subunit
MTTITAVKKGKRICIASDALTLFGSRKEIGGRHVHGEGKIIQVGSNYIGTAGHPVWGLILEHYFQKQKKMPEWKTSNQVFDFFLRCIHF